MSLTETQIEQISDRLRSCGFDISCVDNEQIAIIAACVLEALDIEWVN